MAIEVAGYAVLNVLGILLIWSLFLKNRPIVLSNQVESGGHRGKSWQQTRHTANLIRTRLLSSRDNSHCLGGARIRRGKLLLGAKKKTRKRDAKAGFLDARHDATLCELSACNRRVEAHPREASRCDHTSRVRRECQLYQKSVRKVSPNRGSPAVS